MKVTIDANIRAGQRILDMAESGLIEIATSEPIIDEVLDVLGRKFYWSVPELKMARNRMGR